MAPGIGTELDHQAKGIYDEVVQAVLSLEKQMAAFQNQLSPKIGRVV